MEDKSYYVKQQKEKNPERFYVYIHRRASDNSPMYVGKGSGDRAWWRHHRSAFWNSTVNKHGFTVDIVFDGLDEETAFQCEKDTILELRYFGYKLVNLTDGGDGPSGFNPTLDTRKRMSDAQKNSPLSAAAREQTRLKALGRKIPPDVRLKQSLASKGVPKSETHRINAQAAKRHRTIYKFVHPDGRSFTGTRFDFESYSGLHRRQISRLFGSKPNSTVFGWSLAKNDEIILQNNKEGN